MRKLIKGIIINPKRDYTVDVFRDGYLLIDENGKIENIIEQEIQLNGIKFDIFFDFSQKILIPGLIDLHTHIPQFNAIGLGEGELLDWLSNYIFPLETKFNNEQFAYQNTKLFFKELVSKGTTTAVLYTSPQKTACDIAFQVAEEYQLRAFIGMPFMDSNSPEALKQETEVVINDISDLAKKWHKKGKLEYVLTPRFALSCSAVLMRKIGEIARSDDFFVQSHIAENKLEIELVRKHFPNSANYAEVYDKYGLLTEKTILAHCIYLDDSELNLIKERNCIIAHCPNSNKFLSSGIMPLQKYLSQGLKVGIGTDVAAGYSLSMLNECMEAKEMSKILSLLGDTNAKVDTRTVLCLATIKAAEHLGISEQVGNFEQGKAADFAVFELPEYRDLISMNDDDLLNALLYNIDRRKAQAVFIDGNLVAQE